MTATCGKTLYGYWIGKDEIFDVTRQENHDDVAYKILTEKYNVPIDRLFNSPYSIYSFMFSLGYIRVVNFDGTHGVEYYKNARLSKLQKEFIRDAESIDVVDRHRRIVKYETQNR